MQYTRQVGRLNRKVGKNISTLIYLGNLGRVDFINDYEYDLFIRPDTCNPRYRFDLFQVALMPKPSFLNLSSHFQVLVQLFSWQCSRRPTDHLQHCQLEQNQESLHTGPNSNRQILVKTKMVEYFDFIKSFTFHISRQRIPETNVYYYKSPEHRFEKKKW